MVKPVDQHKSKPGITVLLILYDNQLQEMLQSL